MELRKSYWAVLVGEHCGDSAGAPYEKMFSKKQIATDIEKRGGLQMFDYPDPWEKDGIFPAGRPTDDSDQTAALARSIIRSNGLNPEHLRESLRESVVHNKSRLWDGKAIGAGGTTKRALSDDPEQVKVGLANDIGTNGSLMRCAPMALWLGAHPMADHTLDRCTWSKDQVAAMSRVTHSHQHSIDACWLYTKVLTRILGGANWLDIRPTNPLETRVLSRLHDEHDYPYDPGAWPHRGTAEFSLYVALHSLLHSNSFAEGIEMAVRIGGDTDTYAAIAGGPLGAYYGYDAIPIGWRNTILGHDIMVEYADSLYGMRLSQ